MAILPKPRRAAMHAIYAFCREVDDIADDQGLSADERMRRLGAWREEIARLEAGAPQTPIGAALSPAARDFNFPMREFIMMIEGMEMDAAGPIVAPPLARLYDYTRRVAGAVGLLSMPVFGATAGAESDRFALSLGDALQLTNILRDVAEDAEIGRVYLPQELLEKHGAPMTADAVKAAAARSGAGFSPPGSEALIAAKRELGAIAREKFAQARIALGALDWKTVRPALLMMGVYEAYLDRMEKSGFADSPALSKFDKALIALRWYAAPKLKA
jgi:phytoene synthase